MLDWSRADALWTHQFINFQLIIKQQVLLLLHGLSSVYQLAAIFSLFAMESWSISVYQISVHEQLAAAARKAFKTQTKKTRTRTLAEVKEARRR